MTSTDMNNIKKCSLITEKYDSSPILFGKNEDEEDIELSQPQLDKYLEEINIQELKINENINEDSFEKDASENFLNSAIPSKLKTNMLWLKQILLNMQQSLIFNNEFFIEKTNDISEFLLPENEAFLLQALKTTKTSFYSFCLKFFYLLPLFLILNISTLFILISPVIIFVAMLFLEKFLLHALINSNIKQVKRLFTNTKEIIRILNVSNLSYQNDSTLLSKVEFFTKKVFNYTKKFNATISCQTDSFKKMYHDKNLIASLNDNPIQNQKEKIEELLANINSIKVYTQINFIMLSELLTVVLLNYASVHQHAIFEFKFIYSLVKFHREMQSSIMELESLLHLMKLPNKVQSKNSETRKQRSIKNSLLIDLLSGQFRKCLLLSYELSDNLDSDKQSTISSINSLANNIELCSSLIEKLKLDMKIKRENLVQFGKSEVKFERKEDKGIDRVMHSDEKILGTDDADLNVFEGYSCAEEFERDFESSYLGLQKKIENDVSKIFVSELKVALKPKKDDWERREKSAIKTRIGNFDAVDEEIDDIDATIHLLDNELSKNKAALSRKKQEIKKAQLFKLNFDVKENIVNLANNNLKSLFLNDSDEDVYE